MHRHAIGNPLEFTKKGPWEHFLKKDLAEMVRNKVDYWVAIEAVKLGHIKGARGSYLSPGCVKACHIFAAMAGNHGPNFWGGSVKLDKKLKKAWEVYFPAFTPLAPTDMRQYWQTFFLHDPEIAEKFAKAEAGINNTLDHGKGLGKGIYLKGKAKQCAIDSKKCTVALFGTEGVVWPELTPEQLEDNFQAHT